MSKEWQEASNEYAKVSIAGSGCLHPVARLPNSRGSFLWSGCSRNCSYRPRRSTPSTVSARRVTRARASSRALPPRSHRWIGDEQGVDIGVGRGWDSPHAHWGSEDRFSAYAASVDARHVISALDGPPSNVGLSCSPFVSLWPTSIRKCVYPVLCYNQCISFVAIEEHFWILFDYLAMLYYCVDVRRRWLVVPSSVSGGIRNPQRWCGEPPVQVVVPRHYRPLR